MRGNARNRGLRGSASCVDASEPRLECAGREWESRGKCGSSAWNRGSTHWWVPYLYGTGTLRVNLDCLSGWNVMAKFQTPLQNWLILLCHKMGASLSDWSFVIVIVKDFNNLVLNSLIFNIAINLYGNLFGDFNPFNWRNTYSWLQKMAVFLHYNDVIMRAMTSQITSLTIVYSSIYSRHRSRKTSEPRVTGLCEWNSPVTGEFPAQRASNAENVAIWLRHHVITEISFI